MSVQSEIDRIITAVGNAYSKVSEKGGTVPASQTVANLATAIDSIPSSGAKETWVIKDNAPVDENSYELAKTNISFASAGAKFVALEIYTDDDVVWRLKYYTTANQAIQVGSCDLGLEEDRFYWKNNAYKKLTFDTPPAGDLLTWLQSNAVKQPDDTAVQDTKALTITSNGTVSVTPDAPYDGLSSVDVTVDVAGSGGGGFNVSISIQRLFTGQILATGLIEETIPFKHYEGSISVQSKMSYGGAIFMDSVEASGSSYEYIANLSNVDIYFYSYNMGWTKHEKITSFPYRFPSDTLKAIFIPVANNAIINITYYED